MAQEYKVLRITEHIRALETGGVEKVYRHQIRTRGGTVMTVDIPERDFTADNVAPILKAKAVEADNILTS